MVDPAMLHRRKPFLCMLVLVDPDCKAFLHIFALCGLWIWGLSF